VSQRRVVIIDGGGANIASLQFAIERLGWTSELTGDWAAVRKAQRLILPGVGAAQNAMARLRENGLATLLKDIDTPLLGICLGMQLLFERSAEADTACLGVIPGRAELLQSGPTTPVPHMGWNTVRPVRDSRLLNDIETDSFCYFVHSYAVPSGDATVAVTEYGRPFSSVVEWRNFCGTQFHPERSGPVGAQMLRNFLET
jgi:imidazole glycerol-phosphate synthase subunit HisH